MANKIVKRYWVEENIWAATGQRLAIREEDVELRGKSARVTASKNSDFRSVLTLDQLEAEYHKTPEEAYDAYSNNLMRRIQTLSSKLEQAREDYELAQIARPTLLTLPPLKRKTTREG